MDEVALNIQEDVVIQLGSCTYTPRHAKYFRFLPDQEFKRFFNSSRLVVCHGGDCILECLMAEKPFVVVPRLKNFGEAPNDYQLDLAVELEKRGIPVAYDPAELENVLKSISTHAVPKGSSDISEEYKSLLQKLSDYVQRIANSMITKRNIPRRQLSARLSFAKRSVR